MISIVCTDSGHDGRVAKLARFSRSAEGWTLDAPSPRRSDSGGRAWDDYVRLAEPAQALQGDEPVPGARESHRALNEGNARERFALWCKLCGRHLPVRADKLNPNLEKVDALGVSEIPLGVLAAMLDT